MAVAEIRFRSESIGRWTSYNVLLPETGDGPFPVVIQLHGLSDDARVWIDRSNLVRFAEDYSLAIVMPDGATSAYLNWLESGRLHRNAYEDLIVNDIPDHVRRHFNVSDGPWGIGGLSMGGYGSMRLGLKFPDQFASIWSHSGAFHIHEFLLPGLADKEAIADADVFAQASSLVGSGINPPVISFDCGVDDELLEVNQDLHAHMNEIGLEHHYAEHPGAHDWDYWDEHVKTALDQHRRVLIR